MDEQSDTMPRKSIATFAPALRDNSHNGQSQSPGEIKYRNVSLAPLALRRLESSWYPHA